MAKIKYKVGDMFINDHKVIWRISREFYDEQKNLKYTLQCDMPEYDHLNFDVFREDITIALKNKVFTRCTRAAKILFWKEPENGKSKKRKTSI